MRLFLALELPDEVRAALGDLQRRLRAECRGWRWVAPGGIHLTLRFLGEVAAEDDRRQRAAWRAAAAAFPQLRLRLGGIGVCPGPSRPRVLWAGIEDRSERPRLGELAAALESAARGAGFAPEERPFRPHLTLARAEREGRATAPPAGGGPAAAEFPCGRVTLFRSELLPTGARYTVLEEFPLAGSGGEVG
jgi:2'-5' RNA ligase